jgi:hypothetical protein
MTKLLVVLSSLIGISCVSIAEDRSPANQNSDFTAEYQKQLNSAEKQEVESEAKWHEHKKYLESIDRGSRF